MKLKYLWLIHIEQKHEQSFGTTYVSCASLVIYFVVVGNYFNGYGMQ